MKKLFSALFSFWTWICLSCPVFAASTAGSMIRIYTDDLITAFIIGLILSFVIAFIFKAKLKTARRQNQARNYIRTGSLNIRRRRDQYLYANTTRTRIRDSKK